MDAKFEARDDGVALAVLGRLMLVVWRGAPTAARMRLLTVTTERMLLQFPDGFFQLQVIEANSPPPAAEQRKESALLLERMRGSARGLAFVIEGDSARASLVRTILRGMAMLARGGVPKRFFSEVGEAVAWLAPEMGLRPHQADEIESVIANLRSTFALRAS